MQHFYGRDRGDVQRHHARRRDAAVHELLAGARRHRRRPHLVRRPLPVRRHARPRRSGARSPTGATGTPSADPEESPGAPRRQGSPRIALRRRARGRAAKRAPPAASPNHRRKRVGHAGAALRTSRDAWKRSARSSTARAHRRGEEGRFRATDSSPTVARSPRERLIWRRPLRAPAARPTYATASPRSGSGGARRESFELKLRPAGAPWPRRIRAVKAGRGWCRGARCTECGRW